MEFKRLWAEVAVGAVPTVSIVVHFDVFENNLPQPIPADNFLPMHHFHLQAVGEALSAGIVVAISLGAHAAKQPMLAQQTLVAERAILAAPIRMHDYPLLACAGAIKPY